jgi:predicted Zn-dependent protease with MMP-like domain
VQKVELEGELLAAGVMVTADSPDPSGDGFARLVAEALDDLPEFLPVELVRNVAVTISDDSASHNAYGIYMGGTVANRGWGARIVIFRDTLLRDYGDGDPAVLLRLVTMVVRHGLAHHLGAGELHISDLGLTDRRRPRAARPLVPRLVPPRKSRVSTTSGRAVGLRLKAPAKARPRRSAPALTQRRHAPGVRTQILPAYGARRPLRRARASATTFVGSRQSPSRGERDGRGTPKTLESSRKRRHGREPHPMAAAATTLQNRAARAESNEAAEPDTRRWATGHCVAR